MLRVGARWRHKNDAMKDLIEALTIFLKYKNPQYPTHCGHDVLQITEVTKDEVSIEDQRRLKMLGFIWSESYGSWVSFYFGSA